MATIDEAGRELLLKYLRYYYNERGWHVMPKLSGKKHTHLAYVQQDNKAHDRYDLAFLEQEIKEVNFIDGLVLRAGYVNDATSITGMDYDPRNDPSGKGKKIIDELLACEDDWLIADTPGGGIHIFCHYDPEIKIVLLPGTGIEFKFNHLMVLPPSWNKDKTAAYKFRDPKSPIIALTDKHKAILGLDKIAEKELVEGPKRKIEEILDFKDKIEPGNRHHTLVQVALQIQLSKLPAILGKKLYYDFVKQNCPELLIDRVQEVERIFSDSLNFDYVQEQLKNENEAVTIANRRTWLNPYTPQEMADYVRPKEHWAIEHFVPLYTTTVLTSNPKVGKTMQLIDMAIALATGRKYLDTYETVQGNVLYVDLELDMPEMKRRLDLFGFHKDMPIHFIHDKGFYVNPKNAEAFGNILQQRKIKYFIIDTMRRAHSGKENDSDVIAGLFKIFDYWVTRTDGGCGIISHHNRRPPPGTFEQNVRGSSDIEAACGHLFTLSRPDENDKGGYRVDFKFVRYEMAHNSISMHLKEVDGRCSFHFGVDLKGGLNSVVEVRKDDFRDKFIDFLKENNGRSLRKDVFEHMKSKLKIGKSTIANRLAALSTEELFTVEDSEDNYKEAVYVLTKSKVKSKIPYI